MRRWRNSCGQEGALLTDIVVAMGLLVSVLIPLSYGFLKEARLTRRYYEKAVAMEIVDGEMEILAAGDWRSFGDGTHELTTDARAATNLPPGHLILERTGKRLRLEWRPDQAGKGPRVRRERRLP